MGKPKKGKKKDADWEDDVLNDLESLKEDGLDKENGASEPKGNKNAGGRFQGLDIEDDEVMEADGNDDELETVTSSKKNKKDKKKKQGETETEIEQIASKDDGKSENDTLETNNDNEILDEPNVTTSKKSKKKKKDKKDFDFDLEEDSGDDEVKPVPKQDTAAPKPDTNPDDSGAIIKTAAQKRAEKKEREKKKKEAEKAKAKAKATKEASKGEIKEDDKSGEGAGETQAETSHEDKGEGAGDMEADKTAPDNLEDKGEDQEGEEDGEEKDKKKKKKKKKGEKEEKKVKKPNKALVKQMQEQLEKLKAEEERRKQEEEEKQRALEEAENRRLEKLRLEQERKEKKKQKEKEKKERLKKEGKLLTKSQRQQRAQAQAMLDSMKKQGLINIPALNQQEQDGVRKPVRYGTKKPKKQQPQQQQEQDQEETVQAEAEDIETTERATVGEEDKKSDELQDDDAENDEQEEDKEEEDEEDEEEDEVKDSWDVDSDEETEESTAVKDSNAKPADTVQVEVKEPTDEAAESEEESDESEESEEESDSEENDDDSNSEEESDDEESKSETVWERIQKRHVRAEANRSTDNLRSPVICVLGHVDTGKTKILDKIRHTHVQDGEAGGITQQIGATMVPVDAIREQTKMIKDFQSFDIKLPGLLIIDTPGHESFSNLRSRGSSLCDMAILVVDIMHGLEPQTIESLNLLKKRKTPFVVALNKVDRLFEWKRGPNSGIVDTIKKQKKNTKQEFDERVQIVIKEFSEQALNAALFYNNPDPRSYVSLVPTSAHTGDGMGDLISQVVQLTQTRLAQRLSYSEDMESMVLEVKSLPGLGTTIDLILVNGKLKEGDTIIVAGIEGPIVTQIRALLTPQPLKELRVKNQYINNKELLGAQGVKIAAKDLEKALAGIPLFVAQQPDEVDYWKNEVANILRDTLQSIKLSDRGVYVQASTLGSLEALLEFLRTSKIPYSGVNIGPVHKKDIMKCSTMLEHDSQYAVILAFDVRIEREAQEMADNLGVRVFSADIIYHLFDKFTAYREDLKQKKREEFKHIAVFPCKLRIMPQHIFNSRGPIVVGVVVEAGVIKEGTPIAIPSKEFLDIGVLTGIEANHKPLTEARKGMEVCVKIESPPGEAPKMYGRHFDDTDLLVSKISRESIDAVKEYFREDLQKSDWQLMIELKKIFEII